MHPAICDGDLITVEPIAATDLTPGVVAIYRRLDRLFAHRVVSVEVDHFATARFLFCGDAAATCDAPVTATEVLGEVVAVRRMAAPSPGVVSTMLGRLFGFWSVPAKRMRVVPC